MCVHLDEDLQCFWMNTCVFDEVVEGFVQVLVHDLLPGGLERAEHQRTHDQVQQRHRHDGRQGGAPHGSPALGSQASRSWGTTDTEMGSAGRTGEGPE